MAGDNQPIGGAVAETVERAGAFPRLSAGQMARLRELGHSFAMSSPATCFSLPATGAAILRHRGGSGRNRPGAGRGEPASSPSTGRADFWANWVAAASFRSPSRSFARSCGGQDAQRPHPRSIHRRRSILIDVGTGLKLIGSRFCLIHGVFVSSWRETACRISGSIWKTTRTLTHCSAGSGLSRTRRRWP